MRSRGPSLASRSKREDTDQAPVQDARRLISTEMWFANQISRSSAPLDWQSHSFAAGSCVLSHDEGAKGAKVGHLAQLEHVPPLWSSGGNCGVAALF